VSQSGTDGDLVPDEVVVPLDGSETGARALPFAHAFAGRTGAEVVTVHVGDAPHPEVRADLELTGSPGDALIGFANAEPGRVLCLSSHGRGGLRRALLGSVAEEVVRGAAGPVVVIGPEVEIRPPVVLPRTIVLGVRSDDHGVAALVGAWAPLLGATIERIYIDSDEQHEPPAGARILPGDDPAGELLGLADELPGPILYAVGAPAPAGSRPGRPVSLRLMRHGRGPVLTRGGTT
jgi:nucleotide-binding universal stress UspA family protein